MLRRRSNYKLLRKLGYYFQATELRAFCEVNNFNRM